MSFVWIQRIFSFTQIWIQLNSIAVQFSFFKHYSPILLWDLKNDPSFHYSVTWLFVVHLFIHCYIGSWSYADMLLIQSCLLCVVMTLLIIWWKLLCLSYILMLYPSWFGNLHWACAVCATKKWLVSWCKVCVLPFSAVRYCVMDFLNHFIVFLQYCFIEGSCKSIFTM